MREIKFKFEHLGELFDVYEINFDTQKVIVDNGDIFEISQGHLIQFTGKTDKNGKEIYDGDIVSFKNSFMDEPDIYEVKWVEQDCGFYFENKIDSLDSELWSDCEVIGNIHDNPDLLKQ